MLKLVRMNAGLQTPRDACIKNESCLIYIEGAAVAKYVDPLRIRCAGIEHFSRDKIDVRRWIIGKLDRNNVGA